MYRYIFTILRSWAPYSTKTTFMQATNFDSEFCGNLPIHHINTIQPHGAIILLDKKDLSIIQASVNSVDYLGCSLQELLDTTLTQLTGRDLTDLEETFAQAIKKKTVLSLTVNEKPLMTLVSAHELYYLLEMQADDAQIKSKFGGLQQVRELVSALGTATALQETCDLVVSELKKLLGIDGVMMYKFDAAWNGTVISELKSESLEPYLGVTFPASDVPKQARELYLKNPIRLIPNRDYQAARLYPVINPLTNSFSDLSSCFLRGVADVHLEYMTNMQVMASMSLRVIHNGKLWGLISCNHSTVFNLSFEDCENLALLTNVISTKISSIINNDEYQFVSDLQKSRNQLVDAIYKNGLVKGIFNTQVSVLDLFQGSGAVLYLKGKQHTAGDTPDSNFLDNLHLWLQAKDITQIYATHHLVGALEDAADFSEKASGMLVIPLAGAEANYLVCFRPEVVKTVEWGGNPHQAINFEADSSTYHPRHSFKIWLETVNQTSQPWHEQELQIASTIRSFLLEYKS